ncbi:MAG: DUF1570 domain-containing protein [Planctomycetes bacterium]|nr:DUF1570 domain-containing protein [Planctomycetota bacterium]
MRSSAHRAVAALAVAALTFAAVLASLQPRPLRADPPAAGTVILKDGRRFQGEVTEGADGIVSIKMKVGTVRFKREEVERIEAADGGSAGPRSKDGGSASAGSTDGGGSGLAEKKSVSGVVTLKSGAKFEGTIREQGDEIVVETPKSKSRFKRADVEKIEYKELPAEILAKKLAETPPDAVDALYRLARYAWDNDLRVEYRALLEKILAARPDHGPAAKELARYRKFFERLPLPAEEEKALVASFGKGFRSVRSDHYVVVYDTPEDFALGRLSYLEKLYTTFYPYFEDRGFDPKLLPRPLVAVVFASPEEYKAHGAPAGSGGVYMGRNRQLWLPDPRKSSDARNIVGAQDSVDEAIKRTQEALTLAKTPEEKAALQKQLAEYKEYQVFNRETRRQTSALGAIDTLLHEGFHQLAHNGEVLGQREDFPLWITEGLAEYWGRQEGWAGVRGLPGAVQAEHVGVIRHAFLKHAHLKLGDVMKYTNAQGYLGLGNTGAGLAYAEAWALVHFMIHRRAGTQADKFFAWVRELGKKDSTPDAQKTAWEAAAGTDLGKLEEEWIAYVRGLN